MGAATRRRLARMASAAIEPPTPSELPDAAAPIAQPTKPTLLPEALAAALEILSPAQVAAMLGLNPITLRRWRVEGKGPPCSHEGRNTWYRGEAIKAWPIEREQGPTYRYKRRNGNARPDEVPDPADRRRRPARAASRARTIAQRPRPPP